MKFFQQEVDAAVDALLLQQVIVYPSDTGWSLGCDAEVPPAVAQLDKLKKQLGGPLSTVLVADLAMLCRYAATVPDELEGLLVAQEGPTTYILPASRAVAPGLLAPDGTVGLRVVSDEFCFKVVRRLGHGLVSTPANQSGEPAPALFSEIDAALVRGADHVVNWRREEAARVAAPRLVRLGAGGRLEAVAE